jgi:hypothetical protein
VISTGLSESLPVVARPTINGQLEHEICALVATGVPLSTAARIAGVQPRLAREWLGYGRKPDAKPHWREFSESIDAARREHHRQVLVRLEQMRGLLD